MGVDDVMDRRWVDTVALIVNEIVHRSHLLSPTLLNLSPRLFLSSVYLGL